MSTDIKPYKEKEYKAFIKAIDQGQIAHWVEIARALNVSDETIIKWKQLPEAQAAIQKGIDYALQCMQQAGNRDWRMWEAKLKMLGLNPTMNLNITTADDRKRVLEEYMLGGADARKAAEAQGGSSTDPA